MGFSYQFSKKKHPAAETAVLRDYDFWEITDFEGNPHNGEYLAKPFKNFPQILGAI